MESRKKIKWEGLNRDLLFHIFLRLEPFFLLSTVAFVCRPWGRVIFDRFFTKEGEKTLDFGRLKYETCRGVFRSEVSFLNKADLMKLIWAVMDVYSCDDYDHDDGNGALNPITKMVFPSEAFELTDAHLVYIAKRSPNLRELSIPCGREITHKGFARAMRYWNEIEKMSVGPFLHNYDVYRMIEAAGIICKKLEDLTLSGFFLNQQFSPQIALNLKGLKRLRLEKVYVGKVGLKNILLKCKKLHKVEIWHCLALEGNESDFFASCEMKKVEVEGVIKWSLVGDVEPYEVKNLLNLLWQ